MQQNRGLAQTVPSFFAPLTQFVPVKKVHFGKMIGCFFSKNNPEFNCFFKLKLASKRTETSKIDEKKLVQNCTKRKKSWHKLVPIRKKSGTKLCQNRNLMYPTKH
ncbi:MULTISPECIES: hypothetical protein [unclassified Planococcus (in: firmicutes)]|uniref:hypothetical protein n=1 Tax=unclassified Planococcus (in: firmicutes) TaxID=2662419 RepID=UPI000C324B4C|nr:MULTISPECIES: hypothetical protein [unclassified Planococcus (in: firmicutes)]AUD12477.1 hypothetical protein CW734_01010 [Planococcus sp. MB-3u-03]PKG48710.1 hypothetical protein CXF66_00205 [Planococcus sp. Urea-trap-24]PKG90857.1 hypothetical protein CXF91_03475 [Planococcus sp. Urea-3u-39]PKH38150.1 hypothetical protein CXF77_12615 [Planococcus sp. MB-3u-09]